MSRARFEELKRRVHESETSFKRDSADANELLDTLKLYKEAESDALVQLEKEEEEITRLHLEVMQAICLFNIPFLFAAC